MSKQIYSLIQAGADAFTNMYDVAIDFPWSSDLSYPLTVRATGFEVPDTGVGTYDKTYHGVKLSAIKPEHEYERKFDIEFRLDAAYNLYGQFIAWLSAAGDVVTGGVSNWAGVMGRVVVTALGGAYTAINEPSLTHATHDEIKDIETNAKWAFNNVIVTKVTQPKFSTDTSDPAKYTVSFIFGQNSLPFFASSGIQGVGGITNPQSWNGISAAK